MATNVHTPPQTMEDVKVRTRTGAFCAYFFRLRESSQSTIVVDTSTFGPVVTLVSVAIILSFTMMEFLDYRRVGIDTSVVVDRSRGEKLTVHLNVTFPRVPCYCELLHPKPVLPPPPIQLTRPHPISVPSIVPRFDGHIRGAATRHLARYQQDPSHVYGGGRPGLASRRAPQRH